MNFKKCMEMMFVLAVVVAGATHASAAVPANGFYSVSLTENCNQFYFWTQNSTFTGTDPGWNYASGYQDGCSGEIGTFNDVGFQMIIKKGQPPNDTAGSDRTATDVNLSDLYWCEYIKNCTDMYTNVFDVATDTNKTHLNSMAIYYADGDTFLYEYDEQPITVTFSATVREALAAQASTANLPPLGSFTPALAGTKGKDGVRVK
jgi:hypothetical protein